MKRLLLFGLFATVAVLIVRTRLPKLHERMEEHCKGMFEKMTNTTTPATDDTNENFSNAEGGDEPCGSKPACCS